MLDEKDLQAIKALFAEQEAKMEAHFAGQDAKMEARFAEQDAKMEARFAEQDAKMEARFAEQDARIEKKFDEMREENRRMIETQSKDLHMGLMTVVESRIEPNLQMLAEGQQSILEKMVPPSRLDAMQLDISVLKMAVERLNEKVNSLEGKD